MKLSSRLNGVSESITLKMNSIAREMIAQGKKVINLTAGEPDFPIVESIKNETKKAIDNNFSKYTPVPGIPELRKAISEKLKKDNDLIYKPDEILVSCGAKHSIFNFFLAILDAGDEVLIPAPYWVSYPEMVKVCGGTPIVIPTLETLNYKVNPEQIKKAITKNTKVFIFNSPSNPTGTVYSKKEIEAIAKVFEGTNILVLSDEIYEKLVYEGEFCSFAAVSSDAFSRTVTINGFSKTYSMTGWRLGYAAGNIELIKAMSMIQGQSTSNATSIVQKAALAALQLTDKDIEPMKTAFQSRRNNMAEKFAHFKDCSFSLPHGAFYFLLNIERLVGKQYNKNGEKVSLRNGDDFAFYLLEEAQVVTVPGSGFGSPNTVRISFSVSDSEIAEGLKRIQESLLKLF